MQISWLRMACTPNHGSRRCRRAENWQPPRPGKSMFQSKPMRLPIEPSGVDREIELLLACARVRPEREVVALIDSLLASDLNWSFILRQSQRHGIMPLLYWNVRSRQIPAD